MLRTGRWQLLGRKPTDSFGAEAGSKQTFVLPSGTAGLGLSAAVTRGRRELQTFSIRCTSTGNPISSMRAAAARKLTLLKNGKPSFFER